MIIGIFGIPAVIGWLPKSAGAQKPGVGDQLEIIRRQALAVSIALAAK